MTTVEKRLDYAKTKDKFISFFSKKNGHLITTINKELMNFLWQHRYDTIVCAGYTLEAGYDYILQKNCIYISKYGAYLKAHENDTLGFTKSGELIYKRGE